MGKNDEYQLNLESGWKDLKSKGDKCRQMAKSSEAPSGLALCWQNLEHLRLCTRAVSVFKVVFYFRVSPRLPFWMPCNATCCFQMKLFLVPQWVLVLTLASTSKPLNYWFLGVTVAIQKLIELAFIQLSLRFSSFSVFVDIVYCTSYFLMPVRMKILHLGSQSLGHCACSLDLHQTSWDPVHRCHLQFSNSCQGERTVAGRFRRGLAISVLVHAVVMCGMRTEN